MRVVRDAETGALLVAQAGTHGPLSLLRPASVAMASD
jgi:hypothetical protein